MVFLAGDVPDGDEFDRAVEKLVARARRATASSASTASSPATAVLRLDDIPLVAGYAYTIEAAFNADSTVASDILRIELRYTTDGSTPTVSSTQLPGAVGDFQTPTNATWRKADSLKTVYAPAGDETLSLLLTIGRIAGTGNCTLFADGTYLTEIFVYQSGPDPGDTGVSL